MDKLTFYEQVGIVIPGSVLFAGLLFLFPALNAYMPKEGVTLGQFGIFLLLSYAAGHLVAAIGNALESMGWKLVGGMPSQWVVREGDNPILSAAQMRLLSAKLLSRLNVVVEKIPGYDARKWFPISRQIYTDVVKNGNPQRIETFNGNYGLNRGLCSATVVLAAVSATQRQWWIALYLFAVSLVYGYRAYRFGVHYGLELYVQFLALSDTSAAKDKTSGGLAE
jgi:hypothetical protein